LSGCRLAAVHPPCGPPVLIRSYWRSVRLFARSRR